MDAEKNLLKKLFDKGVIDKKTYEVELRELELPATKPASPKVMKQPKVVNPATVPPKSASKSEFILIDHSPCGYFKPYKYNATKYRQKAGDCLTGKKGITYF